LVKDGLHLLELKYKSWFSSEASTEFDGSQIHLKPKGLWSRKFDIFKNQADKGDIIFKWNGHIIIQFTDDADEEKTWLLRQRGFWGHRFELADEANNLILVVKPRINFGGYDYDIEVLAQDIDENQLIELLTYCGFGAKLYMHMMAKK